MITLLQNGAWLLNGQEIVEDTADSTTILNSKLGYVPEKKDAAAQTMAYNILQAHNTSDSKEQLKIKFDKMTSHDITFVGIIQTARASGLEKFPIPYVLTNCHNSLCAVGGTINEDDHMFGLTCAQKYGGIYVPPHQAVIHQFAREMLATCGGMILGSDSHTRYGALGTMAIGEGGGELAKQLLCRTYDINMPGVVGIYLTGEPMKGVGPQDVALAIIGEVFANGYVNNKVMEFVGPGVSNLSAEFRIGIDVMTTETTCLSSIWRTDDKIEEFYALHNRPEDYKELNPGKVAYYDGMVVVDLSTIKPMIAMPFHPSNTYTIEELNANLEDILDDVAKRAAVSFDGAVDYTLKDKIVDGKLYCDQGIIAGCAGGGFENICDAADIMRGRSIGSDKFTMNVYPASTPIYMELLRNGVAADLLATGTVLKGQVASVALMDARSIAATAANKGFLTPATDLADIEYKHPKYHFDKTIYDNRVYDSKGVAHPEVEIHFGPNIKDWPAMTALTDDLIVKVVSEIHDPVTTTDELIPSGETSSFRSNPLGLAEFTLSRKDPAYVGRAKAVRALEEARQAGGCPCSGGTELSDEVKAVIENIKKAFPDMDAKKTAVGSTIYAVKPGDGSAREQAASCQKVLGGWANIAKGYATKRYRSNLINWGMLPFIYSEDELPFANDDYIFIPGIRKAIEDKLTDIPAYVVGEEMKPITLKMGELTDDERKIILAGCLINYYKEA